MFDDSKPIFQQLAEQIVNDILRGQYAEGAQVPSTNELAAYLRINPATAGKALTLLVERGILVKRRGIGMFVADGATHRIANERHESFARDFVQPLVAEARTIGLDRADLIRLVTTAHEASASQGAPQDSTPETQD